MFADEDFTPPFPVPALCVDIKSGMAKVIRFYCVSGHSMCVNEIGMRECEERIDFEHPHPCFAEHYLLPSFITSYRIMRSGNCTASLSLYTAIFFT